MAEGFTLDRDSIQRISRELNRLRNEVNRLTRGRSQIMPPPRPLRYAKLAAVLEPGGSSEAAVLMRWDNATSAYIAGTEAHTIHDPHYRNYGIPDEVLPVAYAPANGRYEVVGQHGLERRGKADGTITADSSAAVSVWRYDWDDTTALVDTTANITCELDWAHGSENISSGKEVFCRYHTDSHQWTATGAECE
jgi:hypothetical protein